MRTRILLALFLTIVPAVAACADVIWWEGEDAVATNVREHSWLEMDAKGREWLSGGDWLTHMHKDDSPAPEGGRYFARYEVRVPEASRYHLWARQRSIRAPLLSKWRFDDGAWRDTSTDLPWKDRVIAASDRPAVWYRYGVVDLKAGEHTFEMELPPVVGSASFDCFLLYRGRFEPAGKRKPDSDAAAFYEYPENERVEVIVQKAREEAETIRRLQEHTKASEVNRVDFSKIGAEVDVVRFGTDYDAEFRAHNGKTNASFAERKTTLGKGRFAEWSFTAPLAGDYVLTIGADIARLPSRRGKISMREGDGGWRDYGEIATPGQYHCLVTLPQGETRFRLDNVGGSLFYASGARLSEVRGNPWGDVRPGEHPRLQFEPQEALRIGQRISADPDHPVRYYYDGLIAAAESQLEQPSSLSSPRGSAQALNEVAISYALTGKRQYADLGAQYLGRLSERNFGRDPGSVLGTGEYLDCVAWGYDVLYPTLTEAQRRTVRERLDTEAHWLWVQATTLCKDTSYGWWSSDHSNNWQAVAAGGLGMAALALLGESADAEMYLAEAIAQVKMLLDGGFDSDGAYFESPMYHKYAMNYLTPFASALLREGRENLFEYRDQVLHKTCIYNLYMMEPTRDHFAAFNDGRRLAGRPPQSLHPAGGYFARLASQYRDGLVQWLFHTMYGPGKRFPVWNFQHGHPDSVVWHDDTLPVENPDTSPRVALARHWPEHGRVALRTGWSDPNAILLAMECGEYGSHGHADQGTFVLTAYGEHLVDDTGYGGWEATSEAHSVVLIDGEGQRKSGMLGAIRDFVHTEAMDYFEADSTPAYPGAQRVKRHVLFMRPGYFVIVDDVRKDDAPHEYQWLLHSTVQLSTTEIKIQQPDHIGFHAERASLAIRMLSPDEPRSEVVQKQGHTFLRVATPQKVEQATFFAVLYPTSAEHSMSTVTPVRTGALVGAKVGKDLVLWSGEEGQWEHDGLKTDARLAACREAPRSVFVKSARSVEWGGLGFEADQPVTAVLMAKEARLVLPEGATVSFGSGYLRNAGLYETDQDRDLSNDKRVGKVDANGRATLPAGAFTVR